MLLVPSISGLFKWRQFEPEVILLAVGWYLRFSLSYRDVEELLAERGLHADHVTVWRWVQRYAPEMERRLRSRRKPTNDSWRVDETYIRVKGKWVYLYRAVDSTGATIDIETGVPQKQPILRGHLNAAGCQPRRRIRRFQAPLGQSRFVLHATTSLTVQSGSVSLSILTPV